MKIYNTKIILVGSLVIAGLVDAFAQLSFKIGVGSSLFFLIIVGVLLYLMATIIYLSVLSRSNLSWAYPFVALNYFLVTVLSIVFLHEQGTIITWLSLAGIIAGVSLIAKT